MTNLPIHEQQASRFVRICKADHPMRGMIGTITETTEDGFERVTLLNSSFNGYFQPDDLQVIEVGTKVLIEVTISDFFKDSMMIAGGWTPLERIIDIVESDLEKRVAGLTADAQSLEERLDDLERREAAQRRNTTSQCADGSWW